VLKKLLILADDIDVNLSSGGKANYAFICALIECGFSLKVYHYSHKEVFFERTESILIKENKWSFNYLLSRFQRLWQRHTGLEIAKFFEKKIGFSFTFFNDTKSIARAILKENPEDFDWLITLSKGSSYRSHYAILSQNKWHSKWIANIHDPFPFSYYPEPYRWVEPGDRKKRAFIEEMAMKAKYFSFPSALLREWMGQYNVRFYNDGLVFPHQFSHINSTDKHIPDYISKKIKGKFTVLHAGNLLEHRNPYKLIEAWRKFVLHYQLSENDVQLLLIGPGTFHEPYLTELCKQFDTIFRYSGNMNYDVVKLIEHLVSVNLVLEAESEISPFLPAKVPNLVKVDKIIFHIGPKKSETLNLLGRDYSFHAEPSDVNTIYLKLCELYQLWLNKSELKLNKPSLMEYFNPKYLKNQIISINH